MPERPDLAYVLPILDHELSGRKITGLTVKKPVVLRVALEGQPEAILRDQKITGVSRRAHFVVFALQPPKGGTAIDLVIAPMLAGRFVLAAGKDKAPADLALTLALDDGRELRYRDDVQMGKVYVVPAGTAAAHIAGYASIGVDVLDAKAFTRAAFRTIARKRRDQAKVFLMDKSALDSFGNAYADEALWAAKIHPKAAVRTLSDGELDRLHDAIVETLAFAIDEIARRKPPLDEKLRDFLKVRNKHGAACPRCGDKIRKAGVHGHDAFFCPTCQVLPGAGGLGTKSVVDWRKTRDK